MKFISNLKNAKLITLLAQSIPHLEEDTDSQTNLNFEPSL